MNRKAKCMIFTAVFIGYVCLGVLNPLVAPLIRELGLAETDAGWIVSASSVMVLLSSPLWGMLSDRAGRKPVIVLGLLGVAISFLMFGFAARWGMQRGDAAPASLFWLLLVSRLFLGLSFPTVLSASQAYIADITTERERASGMGFVIGPAIGAFLSGVSLIAPVFLCAALPLIGMLWIAVSMPAAKPAVSERQGIKLRRATVPFLLTALILMMAMVQIQVTAGFYFQDKLQLSPAETAQAVGACLSVIGVMMALVQRFVVQEVSVGPLQAASLGDPFVSGRPAYHAVQQSFRPVCCSLCAAGHGRRAGDFRLHFRRLLNRAEA
ncbi:MFS transporter [Paenibacillus sp. TAB 01]|uniref:MFS transporter n=1 Tax=Paenibacillus sp. TAB 01 TaxID=3368988 RepID=UPI003751322E